MRPIIAAFAAIAATWTCASAAGTDAQIIYVDQGASGDNDGSSWTDAYLDLHDALAAADCMGGDGIQIWVAAGEYNPGFASGGAQMSYHLVSGVTMYGGFAGGEIKLDQRDWLTNETVLSGADTSVSILIGAGLMNEAVLDGLTLRDALIPTGDVAAAGGALHLTNSSITVANCRFDDNGAVDFGGAIYAIDAQLLLSNCQFIANGANWGGAIYADAAQLDLKDCTFSSNNAWWEGGGMYLLDASVMLDACVFELNDAIEHGGAIRSFGSTISISQCTFHSNTATHNGGALRLSDGEHSIADSVFTGNGAILGAAVQAGSGLHLTRCTITNNWGDGPAVSAGGLIEDSTFINNEGGLYYIGPGDVTITGCEFMNNNFDIGDGGGVYIRGTGDGVILINDCLFQGNSTDGDGGGLFLDVSEMAVVSNCNFIGNVSSNRDGGGMMVKGGGQVHVTDSMIEGNFADYGGAASVQGGPLILERCTVFDNWGGLHAGENGSLTVIDSVILENAIEGVIVDPDSAPGNALIVNSLITNNFGAGVHVDSNPLALATIINSTIVNNTGGDGGIYVEAGHADVFNSIVWGNAVDKDGDVQSNQISIETGTVNVQHSVIEGLIAGGAFDLPGAGMNNLGDDPLFVNPTPGSGDEADFRLQATSPAIDAGDNAFVPEDVEFDLEGNPRIIDGNDDGKPVVDIGAYEFTGKSPVPPDADLNDDGVVNEQDLLLLLTAWGDCASGPPCSADLDGSGSVGVADLLVLLSNWG